MVASSVGRTIASAVARAVAGIASGGGGGLSAPSITSALIFGEPVVDYELSAELTYSGTADSITYQWKRDGSNISGATSSTYTLVDADAGTDITCTITATNTAGSDSETATMSQSIGKTWLESWSARTAGDNLTTILANGYSANLTTNITANIATTAGGPDGKSLDLTASGTATRYIWLTSAATFLNGRARDYVEMLTLVRNNSSGLPAVGLRMADEANTQGGGVSINNNEVRHIITGEDLATTSGITALTTLSADTLYWVRLRNDGVKSYCSVWEYDTPEPAIWDSERDESLLPTRFGLSTRTLNGVLRVCFWSAGFDVPAPYWPGLVVPVAGSDDPMTYAAASSGTEINIGDTTWSLADA